MGADLSLGRGTSPVRVAMLTVTAMVAFAANSLLCRVALAGAHADPATFTTVRIVSGATVLWLIVRVRGTARAGHGSWTSAAALFAYAAGFSFAYVTLPASTGALLLFAAVQATMIGFALRTGERLRARQVAGLVLALAGLVWLLAPGLAAPPLTGSALMLSAGVAWGVYSLRGRTGGEPTATTAMNFARAAPMAVAGSLVAAPWFAIDGVGVACAVLSGAVASGVGYAVWYAALRGLRATYAATLQLSVPILAAVGGVVLLGEQPGMRLAVAAVTVVGGIALVILGRQHNA